MNKIIISSDSTIDLSPELIKANDIILLPLKVTLGTKTYSDGIDISPDDIYEYNAKTGELPKTAATNVGDAIEFFGEMTKNGDTLIHFSLSSEMTSSYNNCCIAASEFDNVYVIDSRNLSTGGGLLVLKAAELVKAGLDAETIVEKINELALRVDASFVINSLDYLYKGGRCSALSVLGANLLKLKPCIEVKNGAMGVGKKYRGKYADVLKEYVAERLADKDDIDLDRVFVTHSGGDSQPVDEIVKLVKETLPFKEVYVTRAGCTISSHCGPNTLGVLFIRKTPLN